MDMSEYRAENMQRVLNEVLYIGAEYGIDQVNMVNIAKRANLSSKSIKRYYDTKGNLLYQAAGRMLLEWRQEMKEIRQEHHQVERDGCEAISRLLTLHYTYMLSHYKQICFLQQIGGYCCHNQEEIKSSKIDWSTGTFLEEEMKKCFADLRIRPDDTELFWANPQNLVWKAEYKGLLLYLSNCIMQGELNVDEAIGVCDCWKEKKEKKN